MTRRYRSKRIPDSAWRYIWHNFDMALIQTPTLLAGVVFGAYYSLTWVEVIGSVMLGVVATWTAYLHRLHGWLLASQRQMDAAEEHYRKDMAKAGAPDFLVDQIIAHVNDNDFSGAMRIFNKFNSTRP